ncbi:MAG: DUF3820 family protein [Candidatus Anammoxibacter sp.]
MNNIENNDNFPDPAILQKLAKARMPFGKYTNCPLLNLPEPYVTWFAQKGFPEGELGQMLHILHEVQSNGLEYLFKRLR